MQSNTSVDGAGTSSNVQYRRGSRLRRSFLEALSSERGPWWLLLSGLCILASYVGLEAWLTHEKIFSNPIELVATTSLVGSLVLLFLIAVRWLAREIGERQRAENALRESEEYYRLLVQLSPDGITLTDTRGCITFASPRMLQFFGIEDSREVLGRPVSNWIAPEDQKQAMEDVQQRIFSHQAGPPKAYRLVRKDGGHFWGEMSATPLLNEAGQLKGMMSVCRNVTLRHEAEEALRASRDNLSAIFNGVDVSIFIHQRNGAILAVNDKMLEMYRVTRAQTLGCSFEQSFLVSGSVEGRLERLWEEVLAGQRHLLQCTARRPADGSTFPAEVSLRRIRWDGRDAIVAAVHDMTERERSEEKLRNMERHLLHAQRLESIGTLAAGIAHDLNNILAPILMASEILKLKAKAGEETTLLSTIHGSALRGADLVKQVLTFGRGVEGQRVPVQPRHLINEMLRIAQETFPRNISARAEAPRTLWTVLGDSTQLHQVLMNLCVNARDAMPEGGSLVLQARNEPSPAPAGTLIGEAHAGPHVVLEVSDTGQGIPLSIIDKIFDPFFTTKEKGKGTGLGLSTVLGIVRSHGGFLTVESQPARGTTFKVYLPAMGKTQVAEPVLPTDLLALGHGELVLLVDDEEQLREVTARMLRQHGYQVSQAANGQEALERLGEASRPQVLITDLMMPVMDGQHLIRAAREKLPSLKIIASTGLNRKGVETQLKVLQVDGFLAKPYSLPGLLDALNKALSPSKKTTDSGR